MIKKVRRGTKLPSDEYLRKELEKGRSPQDIAREFDISPTSIYQQLSLRGLKSQASRKGIKTPLWTSEEYQGLTDLWNRYKEEEDPYLTLPQQLRNYAQEIGKSEMAVLKKLCRIRAEEGEE